MDPRQASLWQRSPAWRWLLAAALLCTAFAFLGAPWRANRLQPASLLSQFDAGKVRKPATATPRVRASSQPNGVADGTSQLPGASIDAPAAPAQATSQIASPPARSSVVWSNATGSISGAGLIAAYCCAGASATIRANRSASSGRHYWELTLSVRPGAQNPDTWTTAGVTTEVDTARPVVAFRDSPIGPASSGAASFEAIGWNENKAYGNGDVLMFALDAERGLVYYGVNGQWRNGQPGESGGSLVGKPGASFTPYANVSASSTKASPEGDRWIANFGGSDFRYPIPQGFGGYGAVPFVQAPNGNSTRSTGNPTSQSVVGKFFDDEIVIGGQRIPLPPGKWRGLAHFRGRPNSADGDAIVLGRFENRILSGAIGINAYTLGVGCGGFPAFAGCERSDYLHIVQQGNQAFGTQRCWWINHAAEVWNQPLLRAAKAVIEEQGSAAPGLFLNVGFRRASADGYATVFYYFNPEQAAGITSKSTNWRDSEWHKTRISTDPKRVEYVNDLIKWGNSWAPVFFAMSSHAGKTD
jgi:hypothetical protein